MAEIDIEQQESGQKTWIWAAVAIAAVLALMLWLASQEESTGPVVMEEDPADTTAAATDETGAQTVELAALSAAPATFMDSTVRVQQAPVAATLGPRAFWAEIPGQNPFLVVVAEDAGDTGTIASGNELELRGTVGEVTEEVVDQWIAEGAVNEGARDEATFATHYFAAERIR
jgi:hypothetical protein